MARDLQVRELEQRDVGVAAEYIAARQRRLRASMPILPAAFEAPANCAPLIERTMSFADGLAAVRDGVLAGFMLAIKNLPAPTSSSARYAPERGSMMFAHGHGTAPGEAPYPVYNVLFAALAERYLSDGIFEHVAHVPAAEADVNEAWSDLGFGRGHAFAVRDTSPVLPGGSSIEVRQARPEDIEAVYRIACSGNAYHAAAADWDALS